MNNDKPVKQINRVVTPIKVDTSDDNEEIEYLEDEPPKIVKTKSSHLHNNIVELILKIVIGILVIAIVSLLIYLIIPFFQKQNTPVYNDYRTSTQPLDYLLPTFTSVKVLEDKSLNSDVEYVISNDFYVQLTNNNLYINNIFILNCSEVLATFGLIDDLLLLTAYGKNDDTPTLYAFSKNGEKYLEINNINGMNLMDTADVIVYNSVSLVIKTTKIKNDLFLNGLSICDDVSLNRDGIGQDEIVEKYYSLKYKGDHEFASPYLMYEETLQEYKETGKYCLT